jgi:hypothetical protein
MQVSVAPLVRRGVVTSLATLLVGLVALGGVGTAAAASMFATQKPAAGIVLPAHAKPGSGVIGALDPAVLDSPELAIALPGGEVVRARQAHIARNDAEQKLTWTGKTAGAPEGLVVLTRYRGTLAGFVHRDGRVFEVQPAAGGQYLLYEVDPVRVPQGDVIVEPKPDPSARRKVGDGVVGVLSAEVSPVVQDLLVVYTAASEARYGKATLESKIQSAVQLANTAYRDSGVNINLALVAMARASVVEGARMSDTLMALQSSAEVAQLRAGTGADLVAIVNENREIGGIAFIMGLNNPAKGDYAFSAVNSSGLGSTTLAHELGHNQGLVHDRETANNVPGVFAYSFGYRRCVNDGYAFMDIMSYACTNGTYAESTSKFSNPRISHRGYATGVSYELDPANAADAARSLNETAAIVAGYRQGAVFPPSAPASLEASASVASEVTLRWVDTSGEETGVSIERSRDGANYIEIATLGRNTTTFTDRTVEARTTYSYRLRASNSAGVSPYSNVATVTTTPPVSEAPSGFMAEPRNGTAVLSWTDNSSDETGFKIERSVGGFANFVEHASVGANVTRYVDTTPAPFTSYFYRVRAYNPYGSSGYAGPAGVTFGEAVPAAPTDLAAVVVSNRVDLTWKDNATNEGGYTLERSTDGVSFAPLRGLPADSSSVQDLSVQSGVRYWYRVHAWNSSGQSVKSNVVSATPMSVPAAPGPLRAVLGPSGVSLEWSDNSTNEEQFDIERSSGGAFVGIGSVGAGVRSFVDTSTVGGVTYTYRLLASNGGGRSGYSNTVTVAVPPPIPATPGGLAAVNNRRKTAAVSWAPVESPAASRYELQREVYKKKTWRSPAVVASVAAGGALSVIDASGTGTFRYSVRACNDGGCSAYSAPVQVAVTK